MFAARPGQLHQRPPILGSTIQNPASLASSWRYGKGLFGGPSVSRYPHNFFVEKNARNFRKMNLRSDTMTRWPTWRRVCCRYEPFNEYEHKVRIGEYKSSTCLVLKLAELVGLVLYGWWKNLLDCMRLAGPSQIYCIWFFGMSLLHSQLLFRTFHTPCSTSVHFHQKDAIRTYKNMRDANATRFFWCMVMHPLCFTYNSGMFFFRSPVFFQQ